MTTPGITRDGDRVTVQVEVTLSGFMLACEESILDALNKVGTMATREALQHFDTDDYPDTGGKLGRVSPYGVYDLQDNSGWVSVGISADTSEFAVESIRRWWNSMGYDRYPEASELLITADCGGSNGYRTRLWKLELQRLADELGIPVTVCHFPPSTSKWNKIEHRLFSFITINWRGKPLRTYQTVVNLIAATTTRTGLEVQCELDSCDYEKGRKVSDEEMETIRLRPHRFHGEWNYTIDPHDS